MQNNDIKQITSAIIIAAVIIAGAILLKDKQTPGQAVDTTTPSLGITLDPVTKSDRSKGKDNAKVVVVEYADFQCPFCGKFWQETEQTVIKDYVNAGKIKFVYRDYAFLGEESFRASEAGLCAHDQGKFWEFHDYIYGSQGGENNEALSDQNLKRIASTIGLDLPKFNSCFDSGEKRAALTDQINKGNIAGVRGTPKGFIVKNGVVVSTIDGAEPAAAVQAKIDTALK